ncbi:MAG: MFS transporter [Acidimicrobiales bacterium]
MSQLGSQVSVLVLPLVAVLYLHASTFEVGVLTALESVAFLLIGLPAGAWCDRGRRRPVMIASDIVRATLLASIPVAAALSALTIGQLFAVALAHGIATVFFDVSYQSYLPSLVARSELMEGNAKLGASQSVADVSGPTLGGFLVQRHERDDALFGLGNHAARCTARRCTRHLDRFASYPVGQPDR